MRSLPVLCLFSLAACSATEERDVGDWTAVENESAAVVRVHTDSAATIGNPGRVVIDCPSGLHASVVTVVEADVLYVRSDDHASADCVVLVPPVGLRHLRVSGGGNVESDATFPELASIEVTGNGNVALARVTSPSLDVWVRGGGSVDLDWLESAAADFDLSGSGDVFAAGAVDEGTLSVSGSGSFWGADLAFTDLVAEVSGSGDAEVNVTGSAVVTASGSGSVVVWGGGTVEVEESGSGSVELGG